MIELRYNQNRIGRENSYICGIETVLNDILENQEREERERERERERKTFFLKYMELENFLKNNVFGLLLKTNSN